MTDSGSYSTWQTLQTTTWGYWAFPAVSYPIVLPISLRLTSENGDQLDVPDIITSWTTTSFVDTGLFFASSTPSPTQAPTQPATHAPTQPETQATQTPTQSASQPANPSIIQPTTAPATNIILDWHEGSSVWWFAVALQDLPDDITIHDLSVTDSATIRMWQPLLLTGWGYWQFSTSGTAVLPPIHFQVTLSTGESVTFTTPTITPGSNFDTGVPLSS